MSGQPPPPPITDPFEYLQIVLNPDGTLTRNFNRFTCVPPNPNPNADDVDHPPQPPPTPVISKDVPINPLNNTWARIFLPRQALLDSSSLPLIVFFHGGGFILLSADMDVFHNYCSNLAHTIPAVVVSVDYRLAPEHRLPAAYDECVEALHWIKTSQDEWLRNYADFSQCFLMGSSAGGNIAYHVGLRAAGLVRELEPLKIKGLVLHQPFFGGVQRSGSELRLINDPVLPPIVSDVMWDLSLPKGVDRDHEYCNPTAHGGSKELEKLKSLGWKVLINGCDGDPLVDRQMELMKLMEGKGVQVVGNFRDGGFHGEEDFDPSKAHAMHMVLKDFIISANSID
ncbi:Alpha/beta hydrolase-3 [Corchorus olitorius]|uniref:Alpha/beta hydrolase-3 n=1 Tax=Corchorus olitorius TaxID=93759 RepID=A0A1R3JT95_9ROSI|nr:Alpha/beta hydrolase-3 [Corchorus olitorius]